MSNLYSLKKWPFAFVVLYNLSPYRNPPASTGGEKKRSEAQVHKFGVDSVKQPVLHKCFSLSCLPSAKLVLPLTSFLLIVLIWMFIFIITRCEYLGNLSPQGSVHLFHSPHVKDPKKMNSAFRFHTGFISGISRLTVLASYDRIIRAGNTIETLHSNIYNISFLKKLFFCLPFFLLSPFLSSFFPFSHPLSFPPPFLSSFLLVFLFFQRRTPQLEKKVI